MLRFVRRDTLVKRDRLTRHDEISKEFTFCEEQICRLGREVFSRSHEKTHEMRAFLIYEMEARCEGIFSARSAQLRFSQQAKESAFDLDRGLPFRNGKPYRISAYYLLPAKPEHRPTHAATKSRPCNL